MFCIFYEDRNYLRNLWEEILSGDQIYPFDELNVGLIEYYDQSHPTEIPLLFIDEEAGLCGSVILKPLESEICSKDYNSKMNLNGWILEDVRLYIKQSDSEFTYSSKIKALQLRFYKALKEACFKVMEVTEVYRIVTISADDKSHKYLKSYGDFNFVKEYSSENGIVGIMEKKPKYLPIEGNVIPFKLYG